MRMLFILLCLAILPNRSDSVSHVVAVNLGSKLSASIRMVIMSVASVPSNKHARLFGIILLVPLGGWWCGHFRYWWLWLTYLYRSKVLWNVFLLRDFCEGAFSYSNVCLCRVRDGGCNGRARGFLLTQCMFGIRFSVAPSAANSGYRTLYRTTTM